MTRRLLILLAVLLTGCHSAKHLPPVKIILSENLTNGSIEWTREVERRFHEPVIVWVHGLNVGRFWLSFPDACFPIPQQGIAIILRKVYPTRPIVLLSCNEEGAELHGLPNVWYARATVLNPPDGVPFIHNRDGIYGVSSIYEFVEAK